MISAATPGVDYTVPPDSVTAESAVHNSSMNLCFEVEILEDMFLEYEECFVISISPEADVSIQDGVDMATCCIQDNDGGLQTGYCYYYLRVQYLAVLLCVFCILV